jgi:hypothetical protein
VSIVSELQLLIKDYEKKQIFQESEEYKKVVKDYKNLIDAGMAKPRENNLLPIEKRYSMHYEVNK